MAPTLPTAVLGRTGFQTTRLGFGAMELAGFDGPVASDLAERLLHQVLDAGINLIDTAPDYGTSEELIGAHLAGRRDEFFLASKCGCVVGRAPRPREGGGLEHIFTPENIRAGVEQSLRRMRTDRIDLVQVHASPSRAELEKQGVIETLRELREEGKLRFIGMSGVLPDLIDQIDMGVFDVFQIPYSALQPEHEQAVHRAASAGAGTIIRGGVARGAPAPDQDPEQSSAYWRGFVRDRRDLWEHARLDELLDGQSRMAFLLRFVLGHPDLHTTIVGTRNPAHLEANLEAARKGPLPDDVLSEARRRVAAARAAT
jgi:aryl-alcohol dehydrogenase-like predicted oxidoreductase